MSMSRLTSASGASLRSSQRTRYSNGIVTITAMVNSQASVTFSANGVGSTLATASASLNSAAATIPIHTGPVGRRRIGAVIIQRHTTIPIALIPIAAPSALPNVPQKLPGRWIPIPHGGSGWSTK